MPFQKMSARLYPPRHWVLVGYPNSGKSTFAARMRAPILPIDADHRFAEIAALVDGDIFQLSETPADNNDTDIIEGLLSQNMPGSGVKTIIVDSLTAILTPKTVKAVRDNSAGRNVNRASAFIEKSTARAQLQHAVTRWGCDTLWVYHLEDGIDSKGKEETRPTVSKAERAKLITSMNLELHTVTFSAGSSSASSNGGRCLGIKVVWARNGVKDIILWDDSGKWLDMPERIEAAVYDRAWVPTKKEFFDEVKAELGLMGQAAAESLKAAGFEHYDWRQVQKMFDALKMNNPPGGG